MGLPLSFCLNILAYAYVEGRLKRIW